MTLNSEHSYVLRSLGSALARVISDVSGTLAQFMPMKSVFILAADEVPGFFPNVLVSAGTVITSLVLLAISGFLLSLSHSSRSLADFLQAESFQVTPPILGEAMDSEALRKNTLTVRSLSNFLLVAVLIVASALISVVFLLLSVAWSVASALVIAGLIRLNFTAPPYPHGWAQLQSKFEKWTRDSSLWAVVGAAIITLLFSDALLGLTGILLGAVLLRRLLQAAPDFLQTLITEPATGSRAGQSHLPSSLKPAQSPYQFVGSRVGARLLRESLEAEGCDENEWQIIGVPDGHQLSLQAVKKSYGVCVVWRVFLPSSQGLIQHEHALLQGFSDLLPLFGRPSSLQTFAGLPAYSLAFPEHEFASALTRFEGANSTQWQCEWELRCLESPEAQRRMSRHELADPNDFLRPHMLVALRLAGPHVEMLRNVEDRWEEIRRRFLEGPRVINFGGPVYPKNLIPLANGSFQPINLSNWRVGVLGDHWPDSGKFLDNFAQSVNRLPLSEKDLAEASFRSAVRGLSRALARHDFDSARAFAGRLQI